MAAEGEVRRLLAQRDVETTAVDRAFAGRGEDARAAWEVFKVVAALPAEEPFQRRDGATCHVDVTRDGDMLLFETAMGAAFVMDFTRQFSFEDADGEYLGMNGLTLTVEFQPRPELARLDPVQIWGCGGPPWTEDVWRRQGEDPRPFAAAREWAEKVERSTPFAVAFAGGRATRFFFEQSDY